MRTHGFDTECGGDAGVESLKSSLSVDMYWEKKKEGTRRSPIEIKILVFCTPTR